MYRRTLVLLILTVLIGGILQARDWTYEMVDQSGSGRFTSLKVDRFGNVHVAYVVDDSKQSLKYAFRDHALGRWFTMTIAQGASFCSLVLDSNQRPHISFADHGTSSGAKLRYARWDGSAWRIQGLPLTSEVVGYYTSIVLDEKDNPTMSFYEYRGPRGTGIRIRLRTVTWTGTYWESRVIDPAEGSGKFNSMVSDSQGRAHLAYANVTTETAGMRYAVRTGDTWVRELVDGQAQNNGQYVGFSATVAVDKTGSPHLSYANYSNPALKYATKVGGRWRAEVVDQLAGVAYPDRNSIVIDEDGRPYIGYHDGRLGILKLAHRDNQQWKVETVDVNGCGFTSSMFIHQGTVWVSYADESNRGLKVARAELLRTQSLLKTPDIKAAEAPGAVAGRLQ